MRARSRDIEETAEPHWISSTDLMSGLMLIFMLIAVAFMLQASTERDRMRASAEEWAAAKDAIYAALVAEFEDDLPRWQAEIERDLLIVRFREPTGLFQAGSADLSPRFQEIIGEFFPRYLAVLHHFEGELAEIRIEGHTSSEWVGARTDHDAYVQNMILSQGRTLEVLVYSLGQVTESPLYDWGRGMLLAGGRSSSQLIVHDGVELQEESRRVEFRARTNAEERLSEILELSASAPGTAAAANPQSARP